MRRTWLAALALTVGAAAVTVGAETSQTAMAGVPSRARAGAPSRPPLRWGECPSPSEAALKCAKRAGKRPAHDTYRPARSAAR